MSLKHIDGDLIKMAKNGDFDVIIHGCNCYAIMGGGIAAQVAQNFPPAALADRQYNRAPEMRLGSFSYGLLGQDNNTYLMVINAYTQLRPGPDFRLISLASALKNITGSLRLQGKRIGMPKIGAGIGGGNWTYIEPVIELLMKDLDVTIVSYQPQT